MHKLNGYFQISLAVSRIVRLILPHSLDDVLSYSHRTACLRIRPKARSSTRDKSAVTR
jgi:hypothetical protein